VFIIQRKLKKILALRREIRNLKLFTLHALQVEGTMFQTLCLGRVLMFLKNFSENVINLIIGQSILYANQIFSQPRRSESVSCYATNFWVSQDPPREYVLGTVSKCRIPTDVQINVKKPF
jgi:hypothetical protein